MILNNPFFIQQPNKIGGLCFPINKADSHWILVEGPVEKEVPNSNSNMHKTPYINFSGGEPRPGHIMLYLYTPDSAAVKPL